ncbi:MAG: DEAD/DEAH box helicase [Nitrospirae bacterium]|nr:DEAD/DEAH box helicase [Nitrospirota bacterium]
MELSDNKILKCLKELPANNIYYISPRQYFLRGYEYYRDRRVSDFVWSGDKNLLTAKVVGNNIYSVIFFDINETLKYKCDCPSWSQSNHCKHVICALLTIKNTINPELFAMSDRYDRDAYRDKLKAILFSTNDSANSIITNDDLSFEYDLVLEQEIFVRALKINIEKDGRPVARNLFYRLPEEIRNLIKFDAYYYHDIENDVITFLQKNKNLPPLFIKSENKNIPLKWDKTLRFNSKTELDVTGNSVSIKKIAISNSDTCSDIRMLGNNLIADLESGRLGILKGHDGWGVSYFFEKIIDEMDYTRIDQITAGNINKLKSIYGNANYNRVMPLELFNDIHLMIHDDKAVLKDLTLKVNHIVSEVETPIPSYSMIIEPIHKASNNMILKACCNYSGNIDSTSGLFFSFLTTATKGLNISHSLKVRKRWSVLVKTFFELLTAETKNEAQKIIRESLSEGDFLKRKVRQEAKDLLMEAYSRLNTKSSLLRFTGGKWNLIRNNKPAESLLYTIPYQIFGMDVFLNMHTHNEIIMDSKKIYSSLPLLSRRLKEHGIPLFFKGKSVVTSKWDFSFDASRSMGIDWFEIKPEIKCDGRLIDDDKWEQILSQDGVVEDGDVIQILDSDSREILKTISSMYQSQDKKSSGDKREKEIVRIPRLRILDWIYLRNAGVKVKLSEEDEELFARLNAFEKIEKRPLPDKLNAKLRHYQKDGYYWLAFLYEHQFGACLADDMGLGKTLQAITLLAGIKEGTVNVSKEYINLPHLLVLPPSLLFNWENEINRFYPELKIHAYTGKERSTDFKGCDIVLTTYGLIRRDIETLKKETFNVIVFDEAQTVKNIYADTTGAVRHLNGFFKLTMTGTPVENHLGEYYSILDLAVPGLLGDYDNFKSYIKTETTPYVDMILRRTRPFVLRRTKEKILKELPPKIESDIYLELTDKQKALYKRTVDSVRMTIADAYKNKTASQAQIIAITAILKLRQICVSPKLIDPLHEDTSPKIEFLITKLNELLSEGHSALVFSQFTSFLDILEMDLKKHAISFTRLDGKTAVGKRKQLVEGFQMGANASIFLLSLKAGGQGLNLTRASYVFHLDPWWNPAVENQASDRAHRIGQTNKVTITRILMRHTVEEKMMELKKKKLALYNAVMGESAGSKQGLSVSKADFDYLIENA